MALRGKGVIVSFIQVPPEHENELGEWYNREHLDHRVNFENFSRARRYVSADGSKIFAAMYESSKVGDFCSPAYLAMLADQTDWSKRVVKLFSSFDRLACRVKVDQMTGLGGAISMARFFPEGGKAATLTEWLQSKALPEIVKLPGIVGAGALENDLETANAPGRSDGLQYPAVTEAEWVVIVEGADPAATEGALNKITPQDLASFGVKQAPAERSYRMQYANHR